jgi:hypothetical protein
MASEPKTVKVRNISALGDLEVPLLRGRVVKAGEVIEVPEHLAGREPLPHRPVEAGEQVAPHTTYEKDGVLHVVDYGEGLLAHSDSFERVLDEPEKKSPKAPTA